MVIKQIIVQTLQQTKSEKSGALIPTWTNTATITARITETTTTEKVKEIRTYTTKTIILTKYRNLTVENNQFIIDGISYSINSIEKGIWNVCICSKIDIC